jgi:hypothetical protein
MRPVLLGDVVTAARALLKVAPSDRPRRLALLLSAADTAERHGRRAGRSHPRHGDGSLMAAALAYGASPEPSLEDADYCRCLVLVLFALAARAEARA